MKTKLFIILMLGLVLISGCNSNKYKSNDQSFLENCKDCKDYWYECEETNTTTFPNSNFTYYTTVCEYNTSCRFDDGYFKDVMCGMLDTGQGFAATQVCQGKTREQSLVFCIDSLKHLNLKMRFR